MALVAVIAFCSVDDIIVPPVVGVAVAASLELAVVVSVVVFFQVAAGVVSVIVRAVAVFAD